MINRFLKGGGKNFAGQLTMMIVGLLFAGMTVRYLGAGRAGFFILASSILSWVQLAGGSSFYSPAVQKLSILFSCGDFSSSRSIIKTTSLVNILIGLPFAIGSISAFPILFAWSDLDISYRSDAFAVIVLTAISFLLDQWSVGLYALFEAHQRFGLLNKLKVSISVSGNLLRLCMLILITNMSSLAMVGIVISMISLNLNLYFTKKLIGGGIMPGWKKGVIKPLLNFGLLTWLSNTSNVIFFNLTGLVLTKFLGSATLMYIALPQKFVLSSGQVIIGASSFLFPTFSSYGKRIVEVIKATEDRIRWVIGLISFTVFITLGVLGPFLFTILVNDGFSNMAKLPLYLLCIYGIIWAQETFYVFANSAVAKVHGNTVVGISTAIVTLALTWILIPKIGYLALPIAFLIKFPAVIWLTFWSRKILNLSSSLYSAYSAYISLSLGALVWLTVFYLQKYFFQGALYFDVFFAGIGYMFFVLVVYYFESRLFAKYGRINLLLKIIAPVAKKIFKTDLQIIKYFISKHGI